MRRQQSFTTQGAGEGHLNKVASMNAELEVTPTVEMRKELEQKGVTLPEGDELVKISKKFTKWIEDYRHKEHKDGTFTIFSLFTELDKDGSKYITFDELEFAVRQKLRVGSSTMSSDELKALWCVLDENNSNSVMMDEASKFFKLGLPPKGSSKSLNRQATFSTQGAGDGRLNEVSKMNAELEVTPTVEMRKELEQKGVTLPEGRRAGSTSSG